MPETSDYKLKDKFVNETLWQFGEDLIDELGKAIRKKRLIYSQELFNSLDFTVSDKEIKVSFITYGRIHDLKRKRNYKKITESVDTNREIWGIQPKRQPNRKWYASTAYGMLNSLIAKLMYGFSEQEAARMKELLEKDELKSATS